MAGVRRLSVPNSSFLPQRPHAEYFGSPLCKGNWQNSGLVRLFSTRYMLLSSFVLQTTDLVRASKYDMAQVIGNIAMAASDLIPDRHVCLDADMPTCRHAFAGSVSSRGPSTQIPVTPAFHDSSASTPKMNPANLGNSELSMESKFIKTMP